MLGSASGADDAVQEAGVSLRVLRLRNWLDGCGGERDHLGSCRSQRARRQRLEMGQPRDKRGQGQLSADEVDVLVGYSLIGEVGP